MVSGERSRAALLLCPKPSRRQPKLSSLPAQTHVHAALEDADSPLPKAPTLTKRPLWRRVFLGNLPHLSTRSFGSLTATAAR